MTKILNFYKRGRTGRLVFDKRPWVWYNATVTDVDISQMMNYRNGLVVITMKAYYPFGRSDITHIPEESYESKYEIADLEANSALMPGMEWDTTQDFAAEQPITEQESFLLYNPGTERAAAAIRIQGDLSEGVRIYNKQTGQMCVISGLNTLSGEHAGKTLVIDSLSGKVLLTTPGSDTVEYGFLYHDNGFIDVDSNYPAYRDIVIKGVPAEEGEPQTLTTDAVFIDDVVGRYVTFVERGSSTSLLGYSIVGQARLNTVPSDEIVAAKILAVNDDKLTIDHRLESIVNDATDIAFYNEIIVSPIGTEMNITSLVFDYKPTYN